MSGTALPTRPTRERALTQIRDGERFVLFTHERADGDALGSIIAMGGLLRGLGKDVVMVLGPGEFPLPHEYSFFSLSGLVTAVPDDVAERIAVFLDCGNVDRNPLAAVQFAGEVLNIDHHHDNTCFGTINHVVEEASCTAEIVWDLMHGLGIGLTMEVAEALYVGLVTDTGRFSYENTGPRAHAMAAELIEAGVDVAAIYRRIYEDMPFPKLELLARALSSVTRHDDGRLLVAVLSPEDFSATGAEESHAEGIIDQLRAVKGTKVAALIRASVAKERAGLIKVSLRATDDEVDVSAIARAHGGGGHRRAAGFTSDLSARELIAALRAVV